LKFDSVLQKVFGDSPYDEGSEEAHFECPNCGKTKFYVNREKGLGFCFVCQYAVNAVKLVMDAQGGSHEEAVIAVARCAQTGRREALQAIRSRQRTPILNILLAMLNKDTPDRIAPESPIALPEGAQPIRGTYGERYLIEMRRLPGKLLPAYRLRYVKSSHNGPLAGHILFPSFAPDGSLNYWTSRAAFEPVNGKKCMNPKGVKRRGLLYGDFALHRPVRTLYLVEGPLDCISMSRQAVALLGKNLSDEQCWKIAQWHPTCVVACLDRDAWSASVTAARKLKETLDRASVFFSYCRFGDPAADWQHGIDPVEDALANAVPYSRAAELQARLSGQRAGLFSSSNST